MRCNDKVTLHIVRYVRADPRYEDLRVLRRVKKLTMNYRTVPRRLARALRLITVVALPCGITNAGATDDETAWYRMAKIAVGEHAARINDINERGQTTGQYEVLHVDRSVEVRGFFATAHGSVTDIGLDGARRTEGLGINNTGDIIGSAEAHDGKHYGFVRYFGMPAVPVGLSPIGSYATDINDRGDITGALLFSDSGCCRVAFLQRPGEQLEKLGASTGIDSVARAINLHGQVIGYLTTGFRKREAFLKTPGRAIEALGTLGGMTSVATAINNSGQVVGYADTANQSAEVAFLRNEGQPMRSLGTLGGHNSQATAINERGQIVGVSDALVSGTPDPVQRAFLKSPNQPMHSLGNLGGKTSRAADINLHGHVVGAAALADHAGSAAFIWTGPNVGMINLNRYLVNARKGLSLTHATHITDHGHIATVGSDGHAYVLTPVQKTKN